MAESNHYMALKPSAINLENIGQDWMTILPELVRRGRSARTLLPRERFTDVSYPRLMADPHRQVEELFGSLGLPWREADQENLDVSLRRPIDTRRHEYTLERYGITAEDVQEAFGDYSQLAAALSAQ